MNQPQQTTRRAIQPQRERYRVGDVLAEGGIGTIHDAWDELAGRRVAYKRVRLARESMRPRITALFRREYEMLVMLRHPSTIEAYDYGYDAQGPYYTMELLSGRDLVEVVPLPWRTTCRVLRDVASALSLIHTRRLVHRDVSPRNVRILDDGPAKLLDFGALTPFGRPREIAGTPPLMAPETYRGEELDGRSDLFSLGALAYYALTGLLCFPVRSIDGLESAWKYTVPPPSERIPEIPHELDVLVLSLLNLSRDARPASAAHVVDRLTTVAELPPEHDENAIAFSYLRHPPLVERTAQVEALSHASEMALKGSGSLLVLEAEPGLGRTALLDRLCIQTQVAGATVLRSDGAGQTEPYEVARQLAQTGLQSHADPVAQAQSGDSTTRTFLFDEGARSAVEAVDRRARIGAWLRERVLELSHRNPLLLVIDDAHRIDADSLALFAGLTDEAPEYPLLVVLSLPAGAQLDPHVRTKLGEARHKVQLAPLGEAGMLELVCTLFGDVPNVQTTARLVHRESGGNPGAALDLLRLLLVRGQISYSSAAFTLRPTLEAMDYAESALLVRTNDLGAEARRVLELLSLNTGALGLAQLAAASGLSERAALLALEELVRRGLVVDSADGYFLGSDLLRAALARALDPEAARAHHQALARAILAGGGAAFAAQMQAGDHLMQSGGEHELAGAEIVAEAVGAHAYDGQLYANTGPRLREALTILQKNGRSDAQCLALLVPLCGLGFYGDLTSQRLYLDRTLSALAELNGVALARRLTPRLGAKLALYVGLLVAFVRALFRPGRAAQTLVMNLERLFMVSTTATAAAASAGEAEETARIASWTGPFEALPPNDVGYITHQFALATSDIANARRDSACRRYRYVGERMVAPRPDIDEDRRLQFVFGCLNGEAQALGEDGDSRALPIADELEKKSAFFAPHAESARVAYYNYHGDERGVERHQRRAEALALRGGVAWSALSVLVLRNLYGYAMSGNVIGLSRSISDMDRLRGISPSLDAFRELAQAHLDLLRGYHERALEAYERLVESGPARPITHVMDVGFWAAALLAHGEPERAREVCERTLARVSAGELVLDARGRVVLMPRLARAYAALGRSDDAVALLDDCIRLDDGREHSLFGLVHRERALLALSRGDAAGFEEHRARAEKLLKSTQNPWLFAQYEALLASASRLGAGPRAGHGGDALAADSLDSTDTTIVETGADNDNTNDNTNDDARESGAEPNVTAVRERKDRAS